MLASSRFTDADFERARSVLHAIKEKPCMIIEQNFERRFISMKILTVLLILLSSKSLNECM